MHVLCPLACVHVVTLLSVPGEHLPSHADSLYLHPETMRTAGLAIAQPVLLQGVRGGGVSGGEAAWPLAVHEEFSFSECCCGEVLACFQAGH